MTHLSSLLRASTIALVAMVTVPHGARAQAYPSQDVNFICGFAAGSGADIIRAVFRRQDASADEPHDRRPEQAGRARQHRDRVRRALQAGRLHDPGYRGELGRRQLHLFKKPSVDAAKAFQIAATINNATMMIAVRADSPIKTIPDLTAAMKEKGDKASYAFANPTAKVLGAMYKEKAGLKSIEVAYRTGADFLNELYTGKIDYAIPTTSRRWRRRTPAACEFWPSAPASGCRRRRIFRP